MQLIRQKRKEYISYRGVHYVDIGYKYKDGVKTDEICIRFHVNKKHSKKFLKQDAIPSKLDGINTDLIVSNIILNSRNGVKYNVVKGGVQIQNAYMKEPGTLGAVMYDSTGNLVGLSNYHVLYGNVGRAGDQIIQPEAVIVNQNDSIGNLLYGNSKYDCAIFQINNLRQKSPSQIVGFNNSLNNSANPSHGQALKKSGAISDITYGIVDGVSFDGSGSFNIVANPIKPNPSNMVATVGDSGSLWIFDDGNDNTAVGLHYASDTNWARAYAYNIKLVCQQLKISFTKP